ncbi:patatin-like phospholipase family protein [Phenylobacterium sp.]|uniref:patatin-like phospholipase family protein n=1 Tax=Phenylobacterium sp. TaxID=1871053 RepID=UPI0035B31129
MKIEVAGEANVLGEEPLEECDLVMKGGVTSGVVYPYAILELAKVYRFRSIGGTSAGAIAAAFAAAAEYGRQSGDPEAFARLKARCDELPAILGSLFQPSPRFAWVMKAALAATGESSGRLRRILRALAAPLAAGAGAGLLVFSVVAFLPLALGSSAGALVVAILGAILAAVIGAVLVMAFHIRTLLTHDLPQQDFGMCSGLTTEGTASPALTEWIHDSLQFISFGADPRRAPLTFGELAKVGLAPEDAAAGTRSIDLRMMTTNLSIGRPHAFPHLSLDVMFDPSEWRRLFPVEVMRHLEARSPRREGDLLALPAADDLPVLVGVRMSLSFPILIQAVPMHMKDVGAAALDELAPGTPPPVRRILFSDGGITSNFPIHFFDSLIPSRPTFALSLDDMHAPGLPRISLPQAAGEGAFSPIRTIKGAFGFFNVVLSAAKDWQDEMMSVLPGQRQRVVRIRLDEGEGRLNLGMEPELSRRLMGYGSEAGQKIRAGFKFEEHRYRRTLVAYKHLRELTEGFARTWPGYSSDYRTYAPNAISYKTMVGSPSRRRQSPNVTGMRRTSSCTSGSRTVTSCARSPSSTGRSGRGSSPIRAPSPPRTRTRGQICQIKRGYCGASWLKEATSPTPRSACDAPTRAIVDLSQTALRSRSKRQGDNGVWWKPFGLAGRGGICQRPRASLAGGWGERRR